VAEVMRRLRHKKNNASATHFFALSPKPIARFGWKRARLSLPSFIQIHPSVGDLLAITTFRIITRIGDPIRSPIKKSTILPSQTDCMQMTD